MGRQTKTVKVELPVDLWEQFFRLFPGIGERSLLLRQLINLVVDLAEKKDCFLERVKEELLETYDLDE